ncbi:MAG: inosose dehydratase [Chloroflexota bacterium]|nr:MAG: inosose dehydratase [Chloroflexota bacterium]
MIRIANAPCSWGVIEKTYEGDRSYGYERVINEMQATGFAGTELGDWGFMPTDPATLKAELEKRNLSLIASWVTAVLIEPEGHADSADRAVRAAQLMAEVAGNSPVIVVGDNLFAYEARNKIVGRVTPEDSMTAEQWQIFVNGVHHIAQRVREEAGLRTVFHPHCSTWIEAPHEIAKLMEMTDPNLVGLCLDTGHYQFGGGDPVTAVRQHAGRIRHVHFKDCHPDIAAQARREGWEYNFAVGKGLFCELGQGGVDFSAVLNELNAINYTGWVVIEQDVLPNMGTPKEAAQRNRDFLHSIGV